MKSPLEDLDRVAVQRARLGLGQADGADRRMAEDHGRDQPVVEMPLRLAAEQPVGEPPARGDRDRRQFARGRSRRRSRRCPATFVSWRMSVTTSPTAPMRDARLREPEARGVRPAADRPDHAVERPERCGRRRAQMRWPSAALATDAGTARSDELDAVRLHRRHQPARQHLVEAPQHALVADRDRDARAERGEHA